MSVRNINPRFKFFEIGFHGDRYLIKLVDTIIRNCDYFIETGTNVGSTIIYVARTYPHVFCFSCESDTKAFQYAVKNSFGLKNIFFYNDISSKFLESLIKENPHLLRENILFWLDAHGHGFEWLLKREIAFITYNFRKAYVLIDDFKVPGLSCFSYNKHKGQECFLII